MKNTRARFSAGFRFVVSAAVAVCFVGCQLYLSNSVPGAGSSQQSGKATPSLAPGAVTTMPAQLAAAIDAKSSFLPQINAILAEYGAKNAQMAAGSATPYDGRLTGSAIIEGMRSEGSYRTYVNYLKAALLSGGLLELYQSARQVVGPSARKTLDDAVVDYQKRWGSLSSSASSGEAMAPTVAAAASTQTQQYEAAIAGTSLAMLICAVAYAACPWFQPWAKGALAAALGGAAAAFGYALLSYSQYLSSVGQSIVTFFAGASLGYLASIGAGYVAASLGLSPDTTAIILAVLAAVGVVQVMYAMLHG